MTNGQQARMTRNAAFNTFMVTNVASFSTDTAMTTIVAKMVTDSATAVTSSIAAEADNTGYSAEKEVAKVNACATAASLCANSQIKLDILGNLIVSNSLNGTVSYYAGVADAVCGSRLMAVYNVMLTNLTVITTEYLTAAQLTAFLTEITTFTGLTGTTSAVVGGQSVVTKQFATDLKKTNANIVVVKKAGLKYKVSNELFYNGLQKACKIPPITVRHTFVNTTITNSITLALLANVEGTLSKTKELGLSNSLGIMAYSDVSAGLAIATYILPGFITGIQIVRIIRGSTNIFAFAMVPGTMTPEMEEAVTARVDAFIVVEEAKKAAKAAKAKARKAAKEAKAKL